MNQFRARLSIEVNLPATGEQRDQQYESFTTRTRFPTLPPDRIRSYAAAYFNTFNLVYPILDEYLFMNETLPPLLESGFHYGDGDSVLTLFVLALGQLAVESLTAAPIELVDGVPSGICGGTADYPPGLEIFNEGRARIGSLVMRGDIVSIQVLLLQGTYFEANACHVEYWRSVIQASVICQLLAQSPGIAWMAMTGDLLRRAFWSCVIDEDFYHLDLDLPRTNLGEMTDKIRLPNFSKALGSSGWTGGDKAQSLLAFYFLAKVSLQRVISHMHEAVQLYSNNFEHLAHYTGPPLHVISELSRQLEDWRAKLPSTLQWSDEDLLSVPEHDPKAARAAEFSPSMGADTHLSRAGVEVLAVELRARFYYAKFILGRPFVFKALHFPGLMSAQDAEFCLSAIQHACLWPAALAPARQKKRLLPHLFTWTQNFIAILSILWIARRDECLGRICSEGLDQEWVARVIGEMLHWLRDVKQIDGIAEWSWHFLWPLFEEGGDGEGKGRMVQ